MGRDAPGLVAAARLLAGPKSQTGSGVLLAAAPLISVLLPEALLIVKTFAAGALGAKALAVGLLCVNTLTAGLLVSEGLTAGPLHTGALAAWLLGARACGGNALKEELLGAMTPAAW